MVAGLLGNTMNIGLRLIGPNEPALIIAEAGVNHNGNLDIALRLVDAAKDAGADVVKFQTFTAEHLVTKTAEMADYQKRNIGVSESQYAMLKKLELSKDFYNPIMKRCKERGLLFLSTPFSLPDIDFLETLDMVAYKVPSGEITNLPYLRYVASKHKPIILSTGMSTIDEVRAAVVALQKAGAGEISILHSTSNYPPSDGSLNLNVISTLRSEFEAQGMPIGYSDNGSSGIVAEIIARSLGASIIEKHFTLDPTMEGPDHKASLDPKTFKAMVEGIRQTETMLGCFQKDCTAEEIPIRAIARKSIVASVDIHRGEPFANDNITTKRPGTGVSPMRWDEVLSQVAKKDFPSDTLIEL